MHDIDRTQQEFSGEGPFGESEFETGLLSEEEEVALTGELLNVANEDELEEFLGGLVRRVGRAAGGLMRSPLGSALGGVLRDAARRALPLAGGALGGVIGGPIGAQLGSRLAGFAADRLETEDETVGEEEAEFEGARRFVQFAANTVHRAAANGDTGNPRTIAQQAAMSAARAHLPELLKRSATAQGKAPHLGQSGRWVRRGNKIILLDL